MPAAEKYRSLEFDRVLEQLAGHAGSPLTREMIRGVEVVFHPSRIDENLDQTAEALKFGGEYPSQQLPAYASVVDLGDMLARIAAGEVIDSRQAKTLMQFLAVCREQHELLGKLDLERYPRLLDSSAAWQPQTELASLAKRVFSEDGEVRDGASPELARIRSQLTKFFGEAGRAARQLLVAIGSDTGEEAQLSLRGNRFVVMLPRSHAGKYKGSVLDISGSGHSVYFEPAELGKLNAERQHLFLEEDQEVRRILREFGMQLAQRREQLLANLTIMVRLDYIFARARYAAALRGGRPLMNRDGCFNLQGAVHPLLLKEFIAEDLLFENEKALIVSGVNAGGKTVLLKLLGLYSLLAALGCYIPGEARLPYLSAVHADIGDDQSTESNLSTFTAHLQFVTDLWQALADGDGALPVLVLIDEIGTGTEPGEGAGFAFGLINAMLEFNVKLAVTTHYNVLKTLAFERSDVKNVSLEFDTEKLKPTFRVLDNQPGQSFALQIARRWGLDRRIVDGAEAALGTEEQKMAGVLDQLEHLRREAAHSAREARLHAAEVEKVQRENELLASELREAKQKFAKQAEALKAEVKRRMEELLSDTKRKLKNKVRESTRKHDEFVKAASKTAAVSRRQQDELDSLVDEIMEQAVIPVAAVETVSDTVDVGDEALVEGSAVRGQVLEIDSQRNKAVLRVHGKRLNVRLDKLAKLRDQPVAGQDLVTKYRSSLKVDQEYTAQVGKQDLSSFDSIDLHGFTVEEAHEALEEFISRCLELNLPQVRVMHGVGTGRLKAFVADYLSHSPHVVKISPAPFNEGGVGVTIADLR